MKTILLILFLFMTGLSFSNYTTSTDTINDVDVVFSHGNEYIILKNETYITYIIRDLKTLSQIKKDYAYIYDAYTLQQTYIIELENKVDDADKFIESLKNEISMLDNKNDMHTQIEKTLYLENDMLVKRVSTLSDKTKRRTNILKGSFALNVILLLIILI